VGTVFNRLAANYLKIFPLHSGDKFDSTLSGSGKTFPTNSGDRFYRTCRRYFENFRKNLIPKNAPLIYSGDGNRPSFSGKTRLFTECLQIADKPDEKVSQTFSPDTW
jgi:hypothetical protein